MRIATWNINGLRARLEFVLQWLEERQPDVVGLQELKLSDDLFPQAAFEAAGYQALWHGQKSWNGVAILSRKPLSLGDKGLPGQADFGARLISAEIDDVDFITVYCPNGKHLDHDDFRRKLAWLDTLVAHLSEQHRPDRPTVLCGDLNICPAALDSWNEEALRGKIFHTDEERDRFQKLLAWGLDDAFRLKHPDRQAYSWWDYRGGAFHLGHGLRIDFLLTTASASARLREVEIDREYRKKRDGLTASDHAPVYLDLD
ncbi:MAG: exodeoxyribonuclease III [Myxococcota bacterium]